ncbi:MAG: LptF/LptG family permease [Spirochaetales bacterium]|uniref:LptF/LptG family permease n=1 Tax=Candidatus Thalassospirochaeta sargassi TaxID=3119039 RepID=A0AAJ1MN97_9SPIO|nr:LptF/LptG family permease [Spirochaetales bacterium]
MNLKIPARFLIITAASYIIAFLFFLILNNFKFAPRDIDIYFRSGWIIYNTMLQFFNYLIPVQAVAIIFTFSVFYPEARSASGFDMLTTRVFSKFVTIIIIILLSLTALFFVGNEIFKPRLHRNIDNYTHLTKTSRAYLEQARAAADDGRLFDAEEAVRRYLAIKEDDADGLTLLRAVEARIENQYSAKSIEDEESADYADNLDLSYDDALRLARHYLDIEDYYSAYYYAQIASGLSGSSAESGSISTRAWTALSRTEPSKEDEEEFRLFSEKKRGTELLLAGKPIDAYYLFNQLNVDHPEDPDVLKYLDESRRKTRELTYFTGEAEEALNFPGINDIAFLNSTDEFERELVYFGKMVTIPSGTYFRNIEAIRFDGTGVNRHIIAEYGKLSGDHIVLNGIDRENSNLKIYPEYLQTDSMPELYNTLKLNVEWTHLSGLGGSDIYHKMSLIDLIEYEPVISGYGWMVEPLYIEIITRILNPCGFIILSLAAIALGWKYRRFSGRVPVAGFILLPVVVYITALFCETYLYAMRLLCSWIFLSFGKPAAISLLAASQIILLLSAFLLIAGLSSGSMDNSRESGSAA